MKVEGERRRRDAQASLSGARVRSVDRSGRAFAVSNRSGRRAGRVDLAGLRREKASLARASIVGARLDGRTIDGIAVADLLAYWQAGHGAKGA